MISILSIGSNKMFKPQEIEYLSRINRFIRTEVTEIKEDKSERVEEVIRKEGVALLARIKEKKFFALDPKGASLTTESFAQLIRGRNDLISNHSQTDLGWKASSGAKQNEMIFVIGGANGLSEEVKRRAEKTISLSAMIFTHEIARILILEQIYRTLTIEKGMKYHK
ncbi:MAG: 23S rRNA (pseudouridine(1915)-N(3))-methyltransferase RlmH [Nanoarchaeota archaeon]|nr:23S rRNA (pseudouridine(1915)-N(3))-methyltransferase RlmH [Nanoarchaeota archaeon]MBU4300388.1 23S rRNA (pseudouridine(1915)-N(3))-methyltransferase RlmH [Nanoarchaeota archaeon]MBU4451340.1 23S rRNA (pseudouridine(1915)-N(3))-methyltransferase RlmH [Nanoarchaeota archaeon]MCG2723743.1 23S rRNA (pseudouridine(1915)-N(3))-methyltransferase RlmH [archaeon]